MVGYRQAGPIAAEPMVRPLTPCLALPWLETFSFNSDETETAGKYRIGLCIMLGSRHEPGWQFPVGSALSVLWSLPKRLGGLSEPSGSMMVPA
jgi:hypothetical protein